MLLVENEIVQEASIRDKLSMFFTYSIEIIQKCFKWFMVFSILLSPNQTRWVSAESRIHN